MRYQTTFLFWLVISNLFCECKTYVTPSFDIKTINLKDTTQNIVGAIVNIQDQSNITDNNGIVNVVIDLDRFLLDRIEVNAVAQGYNDYNGSILVGKDQQETAILKLTPKDSLVFNPDPIELSSTETNKNLSISNLGLGFVDISFSNNNYSWISLGKSRDTIPPFPAKFLNVAYLGNAAHSCVIKGSISINWNTGSNHKEIPVIKYLPDNSDPVPVFSISPTNGPYYVQEKIYFDASASNDNCKASIPLMYKWDFEGSGTFSNWSTEPTAEHIYTTTGTRTVVLEVKDGANNTKAYQMEIVIQKLIDFKMVGGVGGQNLFYLGDDLSPFSDQRPQHPVFLNNFQISNTEISNEQYIAFLNAKAIHPSVAQAYLNWNSPNSHIKYNSTWYVESGYERYPVVAVSWNGADAFCNFVSGRLPTEAEWEAAARGVVGALPHYPEWAGTTVPPPDNVAVYNNNPNHPLEVNSRVPNNFQLFNMSGNVAEWCSDWYEDHYNINDQNNPKGPPISSSGSKVIRGGSYKDPMEKITVTYRDHESPVAFLDYVGFRVVKQ
ncbi:MAG: SUMF1/EgtB/PvdO family nonheme iron enzyme [Saprospiraceae bacterium]|nr:SUMF1/EgtB/PvdO family nonheme iron enzyme [Saprospiraceae bacterium]